VCPCTESSPVETGFYWLQSRYYDPGIGRFINIDDQINGGSILGVNVFAYCYNNPVNMIDYTGKNPFAILASPPFIIAYAVVIFCVFVVVTNPELQRDLNQVGRDISQLINQGMDYLSRTLSGTTSWESGQAKPAITSSTSSISISISNSFAKVGTQPNYRSQGEWHHLVAQAAPNAQLARNILSSVGIGIHDPINMIYIKTGLHRRLHTDGYYGWANSVVISAYFSAGGNPVLQKANVISALNTIRNYVISENIKSPF